MGLYALDEHYSLATWYEYSGAYDVNTGTDLQLDLMRNILESDNYTCQLISFPKGTDITVNFGQSFSGSLNLVPYSYILGLMGWNNNSAQFTLRIYDKGAQTDLYYGQFAWFPTVVGVGQGQVDSSADFIDISTPNKPFGPYFFRAPWVIVPPGILQIQVTNANPTFLPNFPTNQLQMLFLVAVPKTTVSLNNRRVVGSTDQTGLQSTIRDVLQTLVGA